MLIRLTYDHVRSLYESLNYPFHDSAINCFGIRNKIIKEDKFDDTLGIVLPDKRVIAVSGTTDPGKSPLLKESGVNKDGIFILMPGYYENCWHKGYHKGKYRALVQFGNVFKGWRDNNKDGKLDMSGEVWTNVAGLNFHTTRWDKQVMRVGDFSEGCQVAEVAREYDQIIDLIYDSNQSIFSYALFNQQ